MCMRTTTVFGGHRIRGYHGRARPVATGSLEFQRRQPFVEGPACFLLVVLQAGDLSP